MWTKEEIEKYAEEWASKSNCSHPKYAFIAGADFVSRNMQKVEWSNEKIKVWLQCEIDLIKKDWERFPPYYCGQVEGQIQEREKDAKIELLNKLINDLI